MEHKVLASVRADLIDEYLIGVQIGSDVNPTFEWATFSRRPARSFGDGDRYQVLLEDGRVVIADSVDLDFEEVK
jgi:hypothetical protein